MSVVIEADSASELPTSRVRCHRGTVVVALTAGIAAAVVAGAWATGDLAATWTETVHVLRIVDGVVAGVLGPVLVAAVALAMLAVARLVRRRDARAGIRLGLVLTAAAAVGAPIGMLGAEALVPRIVSAEVAAPVADVWSATAALGNLDVVLERSVVRSGVDEGVVQTVAGTVDLRARTASLMWSAPDLPAGEPEVWSWDEPLGAWAGAPDPVQLLADAVRGVRVWERRGDVLVGEVDQLRLAASQLEVTPSWVERLRMRRLVARDAVSGGLLAWDVELTLAADGSAERLVVTEHLEDPDLLVRSVLRLTPEP